MPRCRKLNFFRKPFGILRQWGQEFGFHSGSTVYLDPLVGQQTPGNISRVRRRNRCPRRWSPWNSTTGWIQSSIIEVVKRNGVPHNLLVFHAPTSFKTQGGGDGEYKAWYLAQEAGKEKERNGKAKLVLCISTRSSQSDSEKRTHRGTARGLSTSRMV